MDAMGGPQVRADDWDPVAGGSDPLAAQERLRRECPVAWTNRLGGFWAITRYDDVVAAARDTATFSSRNEPRLGPVPTPPIEVDRPEHTAYRRLLQPYLGWDRAAAMEASVRALCADMLQPLIDRSADGTAVDIAQRFTYPFPAAVLSQLLRLPSEDVPLLKQWSDEVFNAGEERDDDPARKAAANDRLRDYGRRLVEARRSMALDPGTDLVTGLLTARIDGERLDPDAVLALVRLLLSAGHNSTTSSLGIVFLHVARDPDVQQRLREQPELIPTAITEFLRHESPVLATPRTLARDVEFGGRHLRAGERAFLVWSSANRDPDHYPEPERCRFDRQPPETLVFGRGIHRCVGQPVALLELQVALEELLARTGWIELAGPVTRTTWERYGVSNLPLIISGRPR